MTQELQDKIRIVAEFDGYRCFPNFAVPTFVKGNVTTYLRELKYLTSLDWLHPVACKAMNDLRRDIESIEKYYSNLPFTDQESDDAPRLKRPERLLANIKLTCSYSPVKSEYIDLFNAVVDGIKFLNQQKEK